MTTITTPLPRTSRPRRTVRAVTAPAAALTHRALRQLRRINEGINADDRAPLCDLTLRPYQESRSIR